MLNIIDELSKFAERAEPEMLNANSMKGPSVLVGPATLQIPITQRRSPVRNRSSWLEEGCETEWHGSETGGECEAGGAAGGDCEAVVALVVVVGCWLVLAYWVGSDLDGIKKQRHGSVRGIYTVVKAE